MPAPDLTQQFRRDTDALVGRIQCVDKILIAVSGGPDSVALLLLAHAAYAGRIHAATVDHRLRPANADEARFVANLCAVRRIPHATLTDPDRLAAPGGPQARARDVRYRLLAEHAGTIGCRWIATGHHRDDQAETVLMRLTRGSGLPGLASIRPHRRQGSIEVIRPLLGWYRAQLRTVVDDAGLTPVDDPSNRSPDYDRTRFRALLAQTPLLDPDRLAASASHLGDCEDALGWTVSREWAARAQVDDASSWRIDVADLPRELRRRLVLRAIDEARASIGLSAAWRRDGVGRLIDLLDAGRTATLAGVLCSGGPDWRFRVAPARHDKARP